MGAPKLEVVLERCGEAPTWVPVYAPTEHVTGEVRVSTDEAVQCRGLDLELLYVRQDHHQGTPLTIGFGTAEVEAHGVGGRIRLFEGVIQPGTYTHRFALPAPWPPSYDGRKSSWSWEAVARSDIPWASDAQDRARLRVEVPESAMRETPRYTALHPVRSGGETTTATLKRYALPAVTVTMLSLAAAAVIHAALGISTNPFVFVGSLLVGEGLLAWSFSKARRRSRTTGPELFVDIDEPGAAVQGQSAAPGASKLRCRAVIGPGALVDRVEVILAVKETTTKRERGADNRSYDRPVETILWQEERRLTMSPDDVYVAELPFPAPGSMPYSTGRDSLGRGVTWTLEVRVERKGSSVRERTTCEIDVRPRIAPPLSRA